MCRDLFILVQPEWTMATFIIALVTDHLETTRDDVKRKSAELPEEMSDTTQDERSDLFRDGGEVFAFVGDKSGMAEQCECQKVFLRQSNVAKDATARCDVSFGRNICFWW